MLIHFNFLSCKTFRFILNRYHFGTFKDKMLGIELSIIWGIVYIVKSYSFHFISLYAVATILKIEHVKSSKH